MRRGQGSYEKRVLLKPFYHFDENDEKGFAFVNDAFSSLCVKVFHYKVFFIKHKD